MASMFGGSPPPPVAPTAPPPPPMFGADAQKQKPRSKPQQTSFLSAAAGANPTNTGNKTLLGSA